MRHHSIYRVSDERFDFQILFDPTEKYLDLPAFFVDIRNCFSCEFDVVGKKQSGFEPDVDIKIEYIGLRSGEKLYEELITEEEGFLPTQHGKIMVLSSDACDLNKLTSQIE